MVANGIRICFPVAAQEVAKRAEEINKLNVFPVPDGDTGTNMSLTLATVVQELEALPPKADIAEVAHAITHGSLMGARGNSGVITSQIIRGVAEALVDVSTDELSKADIVQIFSRAQKVAFQAVRKPVEGTILTVLRDCASLAESCAKRRKIGMREMLEAIVTEAYESVSRTPDLLPVLKENGVVDSGAYGFAIFLDAFVQAALDEDGEVRSFVPTVPTTSVDASKANVAARVQIELNDDWEGSEYRYCNEFLFRAHEPLNEDEVLTKLGSFGDCELLVGSYPDYKVHVHSNDPHEVLGYMLQFGQVYEVFIHNMDLEAKDRTAQIAQDYARQAERKALGFVGVAAGSGEAEILRSLGVDVVVFGGQTMNPSTADILKAIREVGAAQVIVLPNNSNIRMAAEAAAQACEACEVVVAATKTVPQGFAAMFAVDSSASLDENLEAMNEAASEVRDGEVTFAIRNATTAGGDPIHAGDVMGIANDEIVIAGSSVHEVTLELIGHMQADEEGDTLTILAGEDMDQDAFDALCEDIEEAYPDLEVDKQWGNQPLYPVIFSIE